MKNLSKGILFFIGWLLSPFTWWNDVFINIPLSYLVASLLFYVIPIRFGWLMIGAYWLTNIIGLYFMYFSGKYLILSSKNKIKTLVTAVVFLIIYSLLICYLDRKGKLLPIHAFLEK